MTKSELYRPIAGKRSIRIIRVHGSSSPYARIECELLQNPLDGDCPRYEAISYCWAGQKPTQPVRCNGTDTLVTKNCEAALCRFRPGHDWETRSLWIDSLCINQGDMQEWIHQVGLMGEIYTRAERVLIWLGNESELLGAPAPQGPGYYTAAFDWMVRLASAADEEDHERRIQRLIRMMQELKGPDLLDFVDFIPWFKRLWVVQEAALACEAVLVYKQATASLRSIFSGKQTLEQLAYSGISEAGSVYNPLWNAFDVHEKASHVLDFCRSHPGDFRDRISEFLGEMRFSETTETKDKVIAIYGLLGAAGVTLPPPGYSKPTADVYRDTAIAILRSTSDVRILEQVDSLGDTPDLISWVPDWSSSKHSIGWAGNYYAAIETPSPLIEFSDDARKLVVKGSVIDTITARCDLSLAHTNERLGHPENYFSWSKNQQPGQPFWKNLLEDHPEHKAAILFLWNFHVLQEIVDFALGPDLSLASNESVLELYHTLMSLGGCNLNIAVKDQTEARAWFCVLSRQTEQLPSNVGSNSASQDTEWMPKPIHALQSVPQLASLMDSPEYTVFKQIFGNSMYRIYQDRTNRLRYKTVFRTLSGKLGIAPHSMRAGDEVLLLAGVRTPMVARRIDETGAEYRLVAHAHLQGVGGRDAWPTKERLVRKITLV